jgi:hypothetical protein
VELGLLMDHKEVTVKKLLILGLMLIAFNGWAADVKVTNLTADIAPTSDDLIMTVDAPGTSPVNKKVTLADFNKVWNVSTFASPLTTNPYTLDTTNAKNVIIWYGATGIINLPAAVAGMNICVYNTGAFTITIDANGTDVIVRDGTAQAGGVSFTLSSGAGNYVCMVADAVNHWVTLGYKGILAQGS